MRGNSDDPLRFSPAEDGMKELEIADAETLEGTVTSYSTSTFLP